MILFTRLYWWVSLCVLLALHSRHVSVVSLVVKTAPKSSIASSARPADSSADAPEATRSIDRSPSIADSNQRRALFTRSVRTMASLGLLAVGTVSAPDSALAAPDCYADCYKNCKLLAPKDDAYCQESCREYCEQPDREDGLSGSVSAAKGEVGILGGSFGTGTVVKGQDKPPVLSLPGLDFSSGAGKKLIGY